MSPSQENWSPSEGMNLVPGYQAFIIIFIHEL